MPYKQTFLIDGIIHFVGDENCRNCDGGTILGPCQDCVGGLVHQQVIDGYNDMFFEKCDTCGSRT